MLARAFSVVEASCIFCCCLHVLLLLRSVEPRPATLAFLAILLFTKCGTLQKEQHCNVLVFTVFKVCLSKEYCFIQGFTCDYLLAAI